MLVLTTPNIEGKQVSRYLGIVTGEAIVGANIFRDILANLRDIVGGRSGAYEEKLRVAKQTALREMVQEANAREANAVLSVSLDYEFLNMKGIGGMLMVSASGTAVIYEGEDDLQGQPASVI